jgi:hypothetical protein
VREAVCSPVPALFDPGCADALFEFGWLGVPVAAALGWHGFGGELDPPLFVADRLGDAIWLGVSLIPPTLDPPLFVADRLGDAKWLGVSLIPPTLDAPLVVARALADGWLFALAAFSVVPFDAAVGLHGLTCLCNTIPEELGALAAGVNGRLAGAVDGLHGFGCRRTTIPPPPIGGPPRSTMPPLTNGGGGAIGK